MSSSEELRALADLLRNNLSPTALPPERQQELLLKGVVAALEEWAVRSDQTGAEVPQDPVDLLRETAAGQAVESVRAQAFQALLRLAEAGQSSAVDAIYRLANEETLLAARQAIITRGWQPSRAELRALFDWFSHLENSTAYPENQLPLLTQAYFEEATPALQRRFQATAAQNRAENWARITAGVSSGTEESLLGLVERYPTFRPTERAIILEQLNRLAAKGSVEARNALGLLFIRHEDQRARQIVLEHNYLPEDAEQRALFFFLAEQWPAYTALDFDHSLLFSAYETAGRSLRRRLLEHSRHTGQMEWLRGLVGGSGEVRWLYDLTDADWDLSIRRLTENQHFVDLWRLAQVAPPIWSAAILDRLAKSGWQPEKEDEQAEFSSLTGLAKESLASPLLIKPRRALHVMQSDINCLAIHPGGKILAAGSNDQRVFYLWDLPGGTLREPPLIGPSPVTRAIAFSPDGELLASASGDNRIRAFRLAGGQLLKTFEGHQAMIRALAIHPDGRTMYSAGFDGSIRFWRFPYGGEVQTLRPGPNEIFSMVLGTTGREDTSGGHLISGGADSLVRVWGLPEGVAAREMAGHSDTVTHLAASPISELVASAGRDGMIRLWNFSSGGLIRTIANPGKPLTALCMHPNDQVLIGGRSSGEIVLWSLSTGQVIDQLTTHRQPITGLVLAPNGDTLYSADSGGHLQVWDLSLFLTVRLPGEVAQPAVFAAMQERLKNPNLSPSEKKWLNFAAELARWRQRFDIELAEHDTIQIGEFDIEL